MTEVDKHGALWLGYDEKNGAELVFERIDAATGLLAVVFLKRDLHYVRVFQQAQFSDPYSGAYWEGGSPSWFPSYDQAVAEALRLVNPAAREL